MLKLLVSHLPKNLIMVSLFLFLILPIAYAQQIPVWIPDTSGVAGDVLCVPVEVGDVTGRNILSFELTVSFDPNIIHVTAPYYDLSGGLAEGWAAWENHDNVAGTLMMGAFWTSAMSGSGKLVCLWFEILPDAHGTSPLAFVNFEFNEGLVPDSTSDGSITVIEDHIGYVTLISPGPPDWGYRLHWVSGSLDRLVFTNFCSGTEGSVGGDALVAGWTMTDYGDSIVFTTTAPLTAGVIDTFWLSHPYCSDIVNWVAGDSSGTIEGPLPVELTTFQAYAGDEQVTLEWRTESEQDNDHFVLYKRRVDQDAFHTQTQIPGHGTTSERHDYEYIDRWVQNGITYEYQLSDVDIAGHETFHEQIISVTPGRSAVPIEYALHQNYPNPFNPTTTIRYDVKETALVTIRVFNTMGRQLTTLIDREHSPGSYTTTWDATGLSSGIYLCRLETRGFVQTQKFVLIK